MLTAGTDPTAATTTTPSGAAGIVGVNTHMSWGGQWADYNTVNQDLSYLGATNIRDTAPNSQGMSQEYSNLAKMGIHLDAVLSDSDVEGFVNSLAQLNQQNPGFVTMIEGWNEFDGPDASTGQGAVSPAQAAQAQQQLYTAVKAQPSLANVKVLNATVSQGVPTYQQDAQQLAQDEAQYGQVADEGNVHVYGAPPAPNEPAGEQLAQTATPNKPVAITELNGINGNITGQQAVDAINTAYNTGATAAIWYDLENDSTGQFGLFNANQPTPPATAIRDLILSDTGAPSNGAPALVPGASPGTNPQDVQASALATIEQQIEQDASQNGGNVPLSDLASINWSTIGLDTNPFTSLASPTTTTPAG